MRKRRTQVAIIGLAVAIAATAVASAGVVKPITVRAGTLVLTLGGGVLPNKLSENMLEPISVIATGRIRTSDGTHPPALDEAVADAGGKAVIESSKFPKCRAGQIESTNTKQAEGYCPKAIVGRGTTEVEVALPESKPFMAKGPLVIFNAGEKNGQQLLLIHAYVAVPVPTAIVAQIVNTKEHKGPYLLKTVVTVPKIAGGYGSVTNFDLNVNRKGYLLADCSKGNFGVLTTAKFADGSAVAGTFIQPCITKR